MAEYVRNVKTNVDLKFLNHILTKVNKRNILQVGRNYVIAHLINSIDHNYISLEECLNQWILKKTWNSLSFLFCIFFITDKRSVRVSYTVKNRNTITTVTSCLPFSDYTIQCISTPPGATESRWLSDFNNVRWRHQNNIYRNLSSLRFITSPFVNSAKACTIGNRKWIMP